ncbi:membrane protein [Nocardioides sp. URHA0020]|uniref:membrane protein n=1 Tax=Nocardioides sp. URHA0020 TaxID=1380392 RepID=UPI0004904588|nr:membrane protein [Nocardioides sp. URHA0020]
MPTTRARAPWIGLLVSLALVAAAFAVPPVLDWQVWPRAPRSLAAGELAPMHGYWQPKLLGPGTLPAIALAVLGWRYAVDLAERLSWRRLLLTSYVVGLAWLLALAFVDGTSGISRVLGDDYEYLRSARAVTDVHALLQTYVERIPYSAPDNWPTHPAGHPPGALLFFVGLVRLGLGGDFAAGLVVTVIAATTALAVMTTLRALGSETMARRAAPFLVLTPAAVFMAVSADALFAAVAAWGLACLALGARSAARGRLVAWSVLAGLLLGCGVMMSYGLPLVGLLAVAVLVLARSWLPLPVAALSALAVVLAFAVGGFTWWSAYPVLNDRYWDGIAADRPASYWMWGNLAALLVCAGPLLGAGLAQAVALRRRADRVVLLLVGAAAGAIVLADLSRMSKAEVERIWLPFVPWLMISTALLPERWRRAGVAAQVVSALLVQQLLYTSW